MDPEQAEHYWMRELGFKPEQFTKTTVTPSRGKGNYKNKTKYGVLTIRYHNKKLRDKLIEMLR
jgi:hypothetical protein